MGKYRVYAKEFIEAWQTSDNLQEVVDKIGLNLNTVVSRAANYRKHKGIPLKRLTREHAYDWDELAEYAQSLLDEGE